MVFQPRTDKDGILGLYREGKMEGISLFIEVKDIIILKINSLNGTQKHKPLF